MIGKVELLPRDTSMLSEPLESSLDVPASTLHSARMTFRMLSTVAFVVCCAPSTQAPSPLAAQSPPASAVPASSSVAAPMVDATTPTPPQVSTPIPGCAEDITAAQASASYAQALVLIQQAGEHPGNELPALLSLLRSAALAGHLKAQERYGSYVVGFWATDEMFWPNDKTTAVTALAMLRVASRRDPKLGYPGLAKDPVSLREEPLKRLPKAWIELAVAESRTWEHCHPMLVTPP